MRETHAGTGLRPAPNRGFPSTVFDNNVWGRSFSSGSARRNDSYRDWTLQAINTNLKHPEWTRGEQTIIEWEFNNETPQS
jgi:hypothetical protein